MRYPGQRLDTLAIWFFGITTPLLLLLTVAALLWSP